MKQKRKCSHYNNHKKINLLYFVYIFLILFIILISILFINNQRKANIKDPISNIDLSVPHVIENSNVLISKNLLITENNGFSTITGTIENTSGDILTNLDFIYILYDDSNNSFYEFEISISDLAGHSSTCFSSICFKNLLNISEYSVTLKT